MQGGYLINLPWKTPKVTVLFQRAAWPPAIIANAVTLVNLIELRTDPPWGQCGCLPLLPPGTAVGSG